jgi:predicted nucleic acid-binding protein
MSVVSDTTAITTLLKVEQVRLLQDMFGLVFVPPAVWDELAAFHATLPTFVELRPVRGSLHRLPGTELLGRGEAEALALARELNAQLLLTDDRKARLAARRLHIPCIGLVGIVVQAKRLGRIPSVHNLLHVIETKGGLYLSELVISEALRMAGEA